MFRMWVRCRESEKLLPELWREDGRHGTVECLGGKAVKENVIWMMVTRDEYELPVLIADSLDEMAALTGKSKTTISSCASHQKSGRSKRSLYVRVEVDE